MQGKRVDPRRGGATCLPKILGETASELDVRFLHGDACTPLLFPAYTEELEDLSPAHIFQRRIHGAGYSYRQCFDGAALNLRQYDRALSELAERHDFSVAARVAVRRLAAPFALSDSARADYLAVLREHGGPLACALAKQGDSVSLHVLLSLSVLSDAGIDEARVRLDNARQDDQRYAQLLKSDAVTQQQYDQIHTNYLAAKARYEQVVRSRATLNRAEQEQGHRLSQNKAAIDVAQAQINLARLNLSYTVITATADGVVGKKNIHVGQLVQPGQAMVDIVDNSELWVVANYRETQLPGISLGAKVNIKVDAVPDVEFEGTVERISDATGSAFSVIPQDNATGNFVKVEQRIPVRIRLEGDKSNLAKLRAGMNVECTVNK